MSGAQLLGDIAVRKLFGAIVEMSHDCPFVTMPALDWAIVMAEPDQELLRLRV